MLAQKPADVNSYIAGFPESTQRYLNQIRKTFKKAAPKVEERISYGIAQFLLNGRPLIYFAGFKNHVSVYPAPRSDASFKKELASYKGGKGTVQFPLDKPLPLELITRIVKFRVNANAEAAKKKAPKKIGARKTVSGKSK
jgi:uncharacterized protein YdhG (YjbR/CyaY superfamily)